MYMDISSRPLYSLVSMVTVNVRVMSLSFEHVEWKNILLIPCKFVYSDHGDLSHIVSISITMLSLTHVIGV